MINRTIKVEYLRRREDSKIGLTSEDLVKPGQKPWEVDAIDLSETFTKFTNKGKVSKTQASPYEIVNQEAERKLTEELAIESQREADEKRGEELSKIINRYFEDNEIDLWGSDWNTIDWNTIEQGDFDDSKTPGWITIKIKTSHSSWYDYGGELNARSVYYTQVPVEIEKEARELQAIRRKHQDDRKFNFSSTNYAKRIVRESDHQNY